MQKKFVLVPCLQPTKKFQSFKFIKAKQKSANKRINFILCMSASPNSELSPSFLRRWLRACPSQKMRRSPFCCADRPYNRRQGMQSLWSPRRCRSAIRAPPAGPESEF